MKNFHNIIEKVLLVAFILGLFIGCSINKVEQIEEDWSFIVFGDLRGGYDVYEQLVGNMLTTEPFPEFAVCCGDMVTDPANEAQWLKFWQVSEPITNVMNLYIARGNHEGNDSISEQIFREQTKTAGNRFYYSFSFHDSYFIILDTEIRGEVMSIVNEQLSWLTNQLDSVSRLPDINNIFLFMHKPLYPQGKYKEFPLTNADELHNLFGKYCKIRIVFAAHDHLFNIYELDSINYITTGGAGANLYSGYGGDYHHFVQVTLPVNEKSINIKTIGILNDIIENITIKRCIQ